MIVVMLYTVVVVVVCLFSFLFVCCLLFVVCWCSCLCTKLRNLVYMQLQSHCDLHIHECILDLLLLTL